MVDSGDIIRRIERVRFTPVRIREGYDMGEVDVFLDDLVQAAREGQAFGPLVAKARFPPVRLREGYDKGEVDAFLAEMISLTPVPDERARQEAAASPAAREQASRVRAGSFRTAFLTEGYPVEEVDAFLDRLVEAALTERSLLPLLDSVSFSRRRFTTSYRPDDVDAFLKQLTGR